MFWFGHVKITPAVSHCIYLMSDLVKHFLALHCIAIYSYCVQFDVIYIIQWGLGVDLHVSD